MLRVAVSPDCTRLEVSVDDLPTTQLHAVWLRDSCGCATCRRPTTHERLLDSTLIPIDITIIEAIGDESTLRVEMSDGHVVLLAATWLRRHLGAMSSPAETGQEHRLWPTPVVDSLERIDRAELDEPIGLARWIDAVWRDGAAVIHHVEPDVVGLRSVAALVSEMRSTNYGITWAIEATIEPDSAVESERRLLVHTDLPYRTEPPGLQLLLAVVTDVAGGASTLVDGFAAAESLRCVDPVAWELLTRTDFTHPYVRDDVEIHGRAPLIQLRSDGGYGVIRRAPDLVGVPIVDAGETPELYRAYRQWSALVDDPARELRIRLEPGDLLAFHNHRLLHGRTAFELGAHGQRHLVGCYLDIDDLLSRRTVIGRSL